jgi:hypothetical protein
MIPSIHYCALLCNIFLDLIAQYCTPRPLAGYLLQSAGLTVLYIINMLLNKTNVLGLVIVGLVFIFSGLLFCYSESENPGCKDDKFWSSNPDIKEPGYVHSSLEPFRLWLVDYFKKGTVRKKLNQQECLAVSSFLRVYSWYREPCGKRSLTSVCEWLDNCGKKWFDPEYVRYDTCYIYDLPTLTDLNAASIITQYLINNPECRINTPEELRKKINKSTVEEAEKLLANPDGIDVYPDKNKMNIPIPSCKQITNPDWWTKSRKWPKNYIRAAEAEELAKKATEFAKSTAKCPGSVNSKTDALRHCYWTCIMTKNYGENTAIDYSDYHEFAVPNSCDEAVMDYVNNRIGVKVGKTGQDCGKGCSDNKDLYILEEEQCL